MTNDNGVTITLEQMYNEIRDLTAQVTRALGKLDESTRDVADHESRLRSLEGATDVEHRVSDHETRLRMIEQWRWKFAGALLVVSVVASAVVGVVARYLTGGG